MLFENQINQYQAYTDRYLAFKVEYRKMVPYVKPKISIGVNVKQAVAALKKLGDAFRNLETIIKKSPVHDLAANSDEVISFIEDNGFIRDIEDNVWYTKNYKQRVVVSRYNKLGGHLLYQNGGFGNSKDFKTINELKSLLKMVDGSAEQN